VLNNRLATYVDPCLAEEQAGFRDGRRCEDQLFILTDIIEKRIQRNQPLWVVFVDVRKAYDRVWRNGLWYKLAKMKVSPKMIRILQEMYSEVQNSVQVDKTDSETYNINIGLKQGCIMSPVLFSIFINDLVEDMNRECTGITVGAARKLCNLLFADDMALLAASQTDMQQTLHVLDKWCRKWRIGINVDKTKTMAVAGATLETPLMFRGEPLDQVSHYKYLGVPIHETGNWTVAMKQITERARKQTSAMSKLLVNNQMSPRTRMLVWLAKVRPGLEYGAAAMLLSVSQMEQLERIQLGAAKRILGCNRHAASASVRGDLGLPSIKTRFLYYKVSLMGRIHYMKPERLLHKCGQTSGSQRNIDAFVQVY